MDYKRICSTILQTPFLLEKMYSNKENPLDLYLRYREADDGIDIDVSIYNILVYASCYRNLTVDINSKISNQPYSNCEQKYEIEKLFGLPGMVIRGDTAVNFMSLIMQIVNYEQDIIYKTNVYEIRRRLNASCIMNAKMEQKESISDLLDKHIRLCYGLGNFYPIPFLENASLNKAKAKLKSKGYNGVMFDDNLYVFLYVMYKYFVYGITDSCVLIKLINSKYLEWIKIFGKGYEGWSKFVTINHFEWFVDSNCIPIQFWNVSSKGIVFDIENYLVRINSALEKRDEKIREEFSEFVTKNNNIVAQIIDAV